MKINSFVPSVLRSGSVRDSFFVAGPITGEISLVLVLSNGTAWIVEPSNLPGKIQGVAIFPASMSIEALKKNALPSSVCVHQK